MFAKGAYAEAVCGDHWKATGHSFKHRHAPRLVPAGNSRTAIQHVILLLLWRLGTVCGDHWQSTGHSLKHSHAHALYLHNTANDMLFCYI
jgi:5-methylcytosine-specific restriction endonuclease McrA